MKRFFPRSQRKIKHTIAAQLRDVFNSLGANVLAKPRAKCVWHRRLVACVHGRVHTDAVFHDQKGFLARHGELEQVGEGREVVDVLNPAKTKRSRQGTAQSNATEGLSVMF